MWRTSSASSSGLRRAAHRLLGSLLRGAGHACAGPQACHPADSLAYGGRLGRLPAWRCGAMFRGSTVLAVTGLWVMGLACGGSRAQDVQWVQRASELRARSGHSLVFDTQRGVAVLFGGTDGFAQLGDLWEWNGSGWTLRQPGTPQPAARN